MSIYDNDVTSKHRYFNLNHLMLGHWSRHITLQLIILTIILQNPVSYIHSCLPVAVIKGNQDLTIP